MLGISVEMVWPKWNFLNMIDKRRERRRAERPTDEGEKERQVCKVVIEGNQSFKGNAKKRYFLFFLLHGKLQ